MHNNGTGLKNTPRPRTPVEIQVFGCRTPSPCQWKMIMMPVLLLRHRDFSNGDRDPGHPPQRVSRCPPTPILRPYRPALGCETRQRVYRTLLFSSVHSLHAEREQACWPRWRAQGDAHGLAQTFSSSSVSPQYTLCHVRHAACLRHASQSDSSQRLPFSRCLALGCFLCPCQAVVP